MVDLTSEDVIKYIKTQRRIGYRYKTIASRLGVKEDTVKKWAKGKFRVARQSIRKLESKKSIILEDTSFEEDIAKLEKYRLKKKSRTYEGEYITKDNYSVLKVVITSIQIENKEELYNDMIKTIKKTIPLWEQRKDMEFYVGCHSYCLHRNLGTQDRSINTRLNFDILDGMEDFIKFFDRYVRQAYVDRWVVVEYWVAGRHNGVYYIEE